MRSLLTCALVAAFAPPQRRLAPPSRVLRMAASESRGKRALRYLAAPPKGVKRAVNYIRERAPDAQTTKRLAKAVRWCNRKYAQHFLNICQDQKKRVRDAKNATPPGSRTAN